jgi:hypothetical protein
VIGEDQIFGITITEGLIDTRILVSRVATSVIIGRALVRSLDCIEAKVWFGKNVDRRKRSESPPFRIPLFEEPKVIGDRLVSPILVTKRRLPVGLSRERYGCWTFVKVLDEGVDVHAGVSGACVHEGVGAVQMVCSHSQGAVQFKFAGL